jgi:AraC family transcriptional activator of mtrCDE
MSRGDHWLRYLTAEGIILAQTRIAGDWGVQIDDRDATFFHFMIKGSAYISIDAAEPVKLDSGDVVLLTRGPAHQLRHSLQSQVIPLTRFLQENNGVFNASPDAANVICGSFGIDRYMVLPALKSLPPILHFKADRCAEGSQVAATLSQLRNEVEHSGLGSQLIVRHLLATLFIYILREWVETTPAKMGSWFFAMQSPHVARALACIHEHPGQHWTLNSLAGEAGLSRAAFARQFRDSVGEPPHSYLTRWRMGIASQLLAQTDLSLSEVAGKVGYTSEYSFSRAFKQARGVSPTRDRAQKRLEASVR